MAKPHTKTQRSIVKRVVAVATSAVMFMVVSSTPAHVVSVTWTNKSKVFNMMVSVSTLFTNHKLSITRGSSNSINGIWVQVTRVEEFIPTANSLAARVSKNCTGVYGRDASFNITGDRTLLRCGKI